MTINAPRLSLASSVYSPVRGRRFTVEEYHRMGEAGILREDERVELIEVHTGAVLGEG